MGKAVGRHSEAPAVTRRASGAGREPIGRYIAQQRKLRGLTLDELAGQTRIPRRSLERLEAGAFDRTPDGFARGFVRTVAEAIGLDPDETVARMLAEPTSAPRSLPRASRALLALAGITLVFALVYAASPLGFGGRSRAPSVVEPPAGLPVRRDYVRELAEARGLGPAALGASTAALPPEPLAPVASAPAPAELPAEPSAAAVPSTERAAGLRAQAPRAAVVTRAPAAAPAAPVDAPPAPLAAAPAEAAPAAAPPSAARSAGQGQPLPPAEAEPPAREARSQGSAPEAGAEAEPNSNPEAAPADAASESAEARD